MSDPNEPDHGTHPSAGMSSKAGAVTPLARKQRPRSPLAAQVDRLITLVALSAVLASMAAWSFHHAQLASFRSGELRLMVVGPNAVVVGAPLSYAIRTTAVDGTPRRANVGVQLLAKGAPTAVANVKTDAEGEASAELATDRLEAGYATGPFELRVEASIEGATVRESWPLPARRAARRAVIGSDRNLYGSGEPIRSRAVVTSDPPSATAAVPVVLSLHPGDAPPRAGRAANGFAQTDFTGAAAGAYQLQCSSPTDDFPAVGADVHVVAKPPVATASFTQLVYGPGDAVGGTVFAVVPAQERESGAFTGSESAPTAMAATAVPPRASERPVADGPSLSVRAIVDGNVIFEKQGRGAQMPIAFSLPDQLKAGDAVLEVVVAGRADRATLPIPLRKPPLSVEFFPEGGTLAEGIENRVFLRVRDAAGRGLRAAGVVLDAHHREIAAAETNVAGFGAFALWPGHSPPYRLRIVQPAGIAEQPLPPARRDPALALNVGTGIFPAGNRLEFNVRTAQAALPLAVTARRDGRQIGQTTLVTQPNESDAHLVTLPLNDERGGVLRLEIHDCRTSPPRLVAERWVYQRPRGLLTVNTQFIPPAVLGGRARLKLSLTDANGLPSEAQLQAVVAEVLPGRTSDEVQPASLAAARLFDNLHSRATAIRAIVPGASDELAMSYLLGTREVHIAADSKDSEGNAIAGAGDSASSADSAPETSDVSREAGASRPVAKPAIIAAAADVATANAEGASPAIDVPAEQSLLVFDNLSAIGQPYQQRLAEYRAGAEHYVTLTTTLAFCVSVGLVLLLLIAGILRLVTGVHLWLPVIGSCVGCLFVGFAMLAPEQADSPPGSVAFASNVGPSTASTRETPLSVAGGGAAAAPLGVATRPRSEAKVPGDDAHAPSGIVESAAAGQTAHPEETTGFESTSYLFDGAADGAGATGGVPAGPPGMRTFVWQPQLQTHGGQADLEFVLPADATTLRVVVDAFADQRLGWHEEEIDPRGAATSIAAQRESVAGAPRRENVDAAASKEAAIKAAAAKNDRAGAKADAP